ncbi:MAG: hypothetical protein HOP00_03915 [Nitrospira sp.]|nr:hypothetical protein [Nitrospira sp.]
MTELTVEQLRILRHMLGIDNGRNAVPYRNYYCANPGNPELHELQRLGLVRLYRVRDGYEWFTCTDMGISAARASLKSIRVPLKARRYAAFLDVRDALPDLTFRQFLAAPEFKLIRDAA